MHSGGQRPALLLINTEPNQSFLSQYLYMLLSQAIWCPFQKQ